MQSRESSCFMACWRCGIFDGSKGSEVIEIRPEVPKELDAVCEYWFNCWGKVFLDDVGWFIIFRKHWIELEIGVDILLVGGDIWGLLEVEICAWIFGWNTEICGVDRLDPCRTLDIGTWGPWRILDPVSLGNLARRSAIFGGWKFGLLWFMLGETFSGIIGRFWVWIGWIFGETVGLIIGFGRILKGKLVKLCFRFFRRLS